MFPELAFSLIQDVRNRKLELSKDFQEVKLLEQISWPKLYF